MRDISISESRLPGNQVAYDAGRPNWQDRTIPNLAYPLNTKDPAKTTLGDDQIIDVIILGDGYMKESQFRAELQAWVLSLYNLKVYDVFAGAFRIRALFTPSNQPASTTRDSYYGCLVKKELTGISGDGDWWVEDDDDGLRFRERLFQSVAQFEDANLRYYDPSLVFESKTALKERYPGLHRNLVVCMFVSTKVSRNVSGMNRKVTRPMTDHKFGVNVAFGRNLIHEFSHSFGLISDEYIKGRDRGYSRKNPSDPSIFTLHNHSYSKEISQIPWLHLSPWGTWRRQAAGNDTSPLVGWLWVGGTRHLGVWHSEYQCLMNGRHDNFAFTRDEESDPTADDDGNYTSGTGANLRDHDRFCLWCQEILVIRICEKTDQFSTSGEPRDWLKKGRLWYRLWFDQFQAHYFQLFQVENQLTELEQHYGAMEIGPDAKPLWQSDLYGPPSADPPGPSKQIDPLADDELYLLTSS